jgi:hypothetical protein
MSIWVEDLADARWDVEDDGREVRRELDRRVIVKGGWATGLYLYTDRDPQGDAWRPPKIALVRWKRHGDGWQRHSHFNLTDVDQLDALAELIGLARDQTSA